MQQPDDIYLFSNSCTNIYKNTLTNFTNDLPQTLQVPKNEQWQICIQYISFNRKLINNYQPNIINIQCSLLNSLRNQNQIIGRFSYVPIQFPLLEQLLPQNIKNDISYYLQSETIETFEHNFEKPEYYDIITNDIQRINIKILDEKLNQIQLSMGHPTVIKLHLKKMYHPSIILHIKSSDNDDLYPNNSNNDFKININPPLELLEQWKVTINSIIFPNLFASFPQGAQRIIITFALTSEIRIEKTEEISLASNQLESKMKRVITTRKKIIHIFEHEFLPRTTQQILTVLNEKLIPSYYHLELLENGHLSLIANDEIEKRTKRNSLIISPDLAHILGLTKTYKEDYIINLPINKKNVSFPRPLNPDINIPSHILIYCNFVKPTILGNINAPLIKVFGTENSSIHSYVTKTFTQPHSFIVKESLLSTLHFEIRGIDGSKIKFLDKNSDIYLTLEFNKL